MCINVSSSSNIAWNNTHQSTSKNLGGLVIFQRQRRERPSRIGIAKLLNNNVTDLRLEVMQCVRKNKEQKLRLSKLEADVKELQQAREPITSCTGT